MLNECEELTQSSFSFFQIQFAINMVYFGSVVIVPNCHDLTVFSVFVALQNLIMFLMFYDFYKKAYRKQKHI